MAQPRSQQTSVTPPIQNPQSPTMSQQQSQVETKGNGRISTIHPVLIRLREELGVQSAKTAEKSIGGFSWTIRPLGLEDSRWAAAKAEFFPGNAPKAITLEAALAAISIVAIDGVPVWEVFSIRLHPDEDPSNPSQLTRKMAADKLLEFLSKEAKLSLADKIYEAYTREVDPYSRVDSYTDHLSSYVCKAGLEDPVHDYRIKEEPEGEFYCKLCGRKLTEEGVLDLPLPSPSQMETLNYPSADMS